MKFLSDLDLNLLCRLKNTLLEDTFATVPSSYPPYTGVGANNVGLICHYDGKIWYWGKTIAGSPAWYTAATTADVPTYTNANRLLVTNGSLQGISSPDFGVDGSSNMDVGAGGTKRRIVNLNDPINDYDAANKRYVDSMAAGLRDFKDSCVFSTIAATGGTFSSVPTQATITGANISSFDTPAVTVTTGMRVLVKNQAAIDKEQNGIYEITAINAYTYNLQRTLDANTTGELSDGTVVFVEQGTTNGKTTWIITDSGTTPVLNTDDLTWVLFSQVAGINPGAGLTMTGNTIDVNPDNTTIQIFSDQVTIKGATAGNNYKVLITATGGASAVPTWGQIDLAQAYVTGLLPTGNGGLGINTSAVTKGSIIYSDAAGTWATTAPAGGGTTLQVPVGNKTAQTVVWTNTTGTGNVVLSDAPTFTTSIDSSSGTFALLATPTNITALAAVTTFNMGNAAAGQTANFFNSSTATSTYSLFGGATINTATKTINIGAAGVSGSTTNINIGSAVAGAVGTINLYQNVSALKQVTVVDGATGFQIVGAADNTKKLQFTSSIATGTTRTWTIQDASGTVALSVNNLGFFAATTSAQLAGVISDETGSGVLVFGTSPTITTSIVAGSASMDIFNTTATTVNAFGAANTLAIGNVATGAQTVNMFGGSTASSTYNFATGGTLSGNTKTLNIGTGGASGSTTVINLGATTGTTVNLYGSLQVTDGANGFTIKNAADATRRAQFSCGTIATGTTRTYTFDNASGTLAMIAVHHLGQFAATTSAQLAGVISDETGSGVLVFGTSPTFTTSILSSGSTMDVFNTVATTVNMVGAVTTFTLGNTTTAAQTVTLFGNSTGASTYNLANGATAAATTKVINIGTGGVSTSVTNINFGSATSGATGTAAFQNITLTATTPIFATSVTTGSSSIDVFNTTATTVNAFGAATTLAIGNVATGAQTVNMFAGSTGASTYNFATGATANATTKTINIGGSGISGSITNINIGSSVAGATGTTTVRTAMVVNDGNTGNFFSIANVSDATKKIAFSASGITTGNIRTLTIQDSSGTVAYLGNTLNQFAATTSAQLAAVITDETGSGLLVFNTSPTFATSIVGGATMAVFDTVSTTINAFNAATTLTIGGAAGAQTVTIGGGSTATSTYNFATGVTGSGNTKTVNIGTGGGAGSTTNINIGAGAGGTVTINTTLLAATLNTNDSTFSIRNTADTTKIAKFDCATIGTGTTRTFTFQNATGTLALLSNTLNQFASTTSAQLASVISDETGSGLVVFNNSPALTTPMITTGIDDANGALMFGFTPTGTAVNYFNFTNSATTAGKVYLGTLGTDANINLQLEPKATTTTSSSWGAITWKDNATNAQVLRMCRTWGFTLATNAPDRNNQPLTLSQSMVIAHEFGTQDIMVMVTEVGTGAMVMTDWIKTPGQETRQITVNFKSTPANNAYRITVIG